MTSFKKELLVLGVNMFDTCLLGRKAEVWMGIKQIFSHLWGSSDTSSLPVAVDGNFLEVVQWILFNHEQWHDA
eukprot:6854925-Prorocentrum_lima.AAC.1